MYSSVILNIFTLLCNQSPEFSYLAKLKLYPLNNNSPFLLPPTPNNHHSTFCFCAFHYTLDTSYKWTHIAFVIINDQCKSNQMQIKTINITLYPLGWQLPKKPPKITSIGKDVEKLEHLCTIGGITKWYNHY